MLSGAVSHISVIMALIFYALSSGFFLHAFPQIKKRIKIHRMAFLFFVIATFCITVAVANSMLANYYTQTSGLLLIAVVSCLTIWLHVGSQIQTIGIFVAPVATLILLFLGFKYSSTTLHIAADRPHYLAELHITCSVLGQSFAIIGFAIATLYLLQQRALKSKQLNFISKATPPLHKLQHSLMLSLWLGFFFLTLGLISGVVYTMFLSKLVVSSIYGKIAWALAVWVWYLAILLTKNVFGKSGSVISKMSCLGFLLLMLTFFGLTEIGNVID